MNESWVHRFLRLFTGHRKAQSPAQDAALPANTGATLVSRHLGSPQAARPDNVSGRSRRVPGIPGPDRMLVYAFQHGALPEAVFENHPELIRDLNDPTALTPLLHFWMKAEIQVTRAMGATALSAGAAESEAKQQLFDATVIHRFQRSGYTVYIVAMPLPESLTEAYFAGIVHKDDEPHRHGQVSPSTRYFTLEQSTTPRPMLCERRADGSHLNLGVGPAPELAAFMEAVFTQVTGPVTPA